MSFKRSSCLGTRYASLRPGVYLCHIGPTICIHICTNPHAIDTRGPSAELLAELRSGKWQNRFSYDGANNAIPPGIVASFPAVLAPPLEGDDIGSRNSLDWDSICPGGTSRALGGGGGDTPPTSTLSDDVPLHASPLKNPSRRIIRYFVKALSYHKLVFCVLTVATGVMVLVLIGAKKSDRRWVMKKPFLYALVAMVLLTALWASVWAGVALVCVMRGGRGEGGEGRRLDVEGCGEDWDGSMTDKSGDEAGKWLGRESECSRCAGEERADAEGEIEKTQCGEDKEGSHPAVVHMDDGVHRMPFRTLNNLSLTVSRCDFIHKSELDHLPSGRPHIMDCSEKVRHLWSLDEEETRSSAMPEDRIGDNVRREREQTGSTSPPACCKDLGHDSLSSAGKKDDDEGGAAAVENMTASSDMRLKNDLEGVELYRSSTASSPLSLNTRGSSFRVHHACWYVVKMRTV
ncbi:hypothetical protein LTS18_012976 [Coniosporium uncinatum]|uniref:Uncharacterized protein n=1 Tax=Coniosporium uncinatum TaxID=93489 RepID=A0ACC3D9I7_9PEZI|nr:hypothetical protein LTS18_012976 [Coniosporium uncinatum]